MLRKNHLIWENLYSIEEADVILLGVPFDSTSTGYPGARFAPNKVREQFEHVYPYDKDLGELSEVRLHDAGNIEAVHGDVKKTHEIIFNEVKELKDSNPKAKLIVLGGEHSITLPVMKALEPENYLCLDAHWDLLDDYDGLKESHACVNRRVSEIVRNCEVMGARTGEKQEYEHSKKLGKASDPLYLSIDVDVFESVPTGCVSPNGWTLEQAWDKIKDREITAVDVVEYNPMLGESWLVPELVKRLILKLSR